MTKEELKKICDLATPAPWGPYTANIPFYAVVEKPAPSLSKHDDRPTYWRLEDAAFVAAAREWMPKLLEENQRLREALEEIASTSDSDFLGKWVSEYMLRDIARAALEEK